MPRHWAGMAEEEGEWPLQYCCCSPGGGRWAPPTRNNWLTEGPGAYCFLRRLGAKPGQFLRHSLRPVCERVHPSCTTSPSLIDRSLLPYPVGIFGNGVCSAPMAWMKSPFGSKVYPSQGPWDSGKCFPSEVNSEVEAPRMTKIWSNFHTTKSDKFMVII